jgi:hypothetical protein
VPPVNKHCHRCLAGEEKKCQRLRKGKCRKKTKGRGASISVEKLTLPEEKTPKSNPDIPGWGLDIGLQPNSGKTNFAVKSQSSIAGWIYGKRNMQHKAMMSWKIKKAENKKKTGRKQLRTEELGETGLRRRNPTEGCSAK